MRARVLIADDREDIRQAVNMLLRGRQMDCKTVSSPDEVLAALSKEEFDLLLLDMNFAKDITSGQEGLDTIGRVRRIEPHIPIVVMTAWATVKLAVETLRKGANDFIEKPWDNQRLLRIAATQIELSRALARERVLRQENARLKGTDPQLIAGAKTMQPILALIDRIAPTDANILITGENGTGKGLVANVIHRLSRRASAPMITVNTGALSENLFESELFGHVKGAFTDARENRVGRFKLADGGTLFLDEIGNVSPAMQAKLLRVIETGEFEAVGSSKTQRVQVRLITATNADLPKMVAQGSFRQDLYYRLNTITIELPPLRQRREDIPALAHHFLKVHGEKYDRGQLGLADCAIAQLQAHQWPGNIRELDHAILRGVLMAADVQVKAADLQLAPQSAQTKFPFEEKTLDEVEHHLITLCLDRFDGNVKEAAKHLGLGRSSLYRRLEKYGIVVAR